jgi:hypothetical protein
MTYRRLKEELDKFTPEQLDCDVSFMLPDKEFYEMDGQIHFTGQEGEDDPSDGILDEGHPWLSMYCDLG